jgi:hypothetical protein
LIYHRYTVSESESFRKSFVARWLRCGSAIVGMEAMQKEEKELVDSWIVALFGDGISDELIR